MKQQPAVAAAAAAAAGAAAAAAAARETFDGAAVPARVDASAKCRLWGSARMSYAICAFLAMVVHLCMRNTLNFVILCMIKYNETEQHEIPIARHGDPNDVDYRCGHKQYYNTTISMTGDLTWTRSQELSLQGTFYYGYVLTLPIAGRLVDRFGGKLFFVHSITGQAIIFLLIPYCARYSYRAMMALLIIQGLIAGCGNPAIYQLFSTWAHRSERTALLSFAFGGYSVGAVIVFPISSYLCRFGWHTAFYLVGSVCLVVGICFHWFVYSTLDEHPRLSREEHNYLAGENVNIVKAAKTPWKAILTSAPIAAYVFTHIFHSYGLIMFTIMMPRYLSEAMRFPMEQLGLISSVPFLGSFISKTVTITSCSVIEKRPNINLTKLRRITYVICNTLTILCIIGIIKADCMQKLFVVLLIVFVIISSDIAFSGAYFPSLLFMAPSYSGLITGIANCLATMSGFIAPMLISKLVKDGLKFEWDYVMLTLIGSYSLGAATYGIFGSSELQAFN